VHGIVRRASSFNTSRLEHVYQDPHEANRRLVLHYGDVTDGNVLAKLVRQIGPREVYNLAAQSHVRVSFDQPIHTTDVVATGTAKLLEAVRNFQQESGREVRFFQASSSEQYGQVAETPQRETTPFHPRSPYACAKAYAHWITVNYRESYGSTTNRRDGGRRLSRGRSHARRDGSNLGFRRSCSWATWRRSATGDSRGTMCGRCG
jgi:GDPmannose 4,6-dehydratase